MSRLCEAGTLRRDTRTNRRAPEGVPGRCDMVRRSARRDRDQRSEPERAPELLARVEQSRGETRLSVGYSCDGVQGERDEGEPHPEPDDHERPEDRRVAARRREERHPPEPPGDEERSAEEEGSDAEAPDEAGHHEARDAHRHREWEVGEPGVDGAVVQHLLEELGEEVEQREHGATEEQHDGEAATPVPVRQEAHRHERGGRVPLDEHETSQQHHSPREHRQRGRVPPTRRGGALQSVDREGKAPGDRERPREVETAGAPLRARQHRRADQEEGEADGDVHEQHPAPGERVDEGAAREQADGCAGAGHPCVDGHGAMARGSLGEGRRDERERRRGCDRRADALDGARGDEPCLRRRKPAQQGRQAEERDAGEEHPSPAEEIAASPAEQEQPPEGEDVGVDDPDQTGRGEAEGALHRRERDVHDGEIEHHHELGRGDHHERESEVLVRAGATHGELGRVGCRGHRAPPVAGFAAAPAPRVLRARPDHSGAVAPWSASGRSGPRSVSRRPSAS